MADLVIHAHACFTQAVTKCVKDGPLRTIRFDGGSSWLAKSACCISIQTQIFNRRSQRRQSACSSWERKPDRYSWNALQSVSIYPTSHHVFYDRIRCTAPPHAAPPPLADGLYAAGTGPLLKNCFTSAELKPLADTWGCSFTLGPLEPLPPIEFRCMPQALFAGVWERLVLSCLGACDGLGWIGEAVPDREVLFCFPPRFQTLWDESKLGIANGDVDCVHTCLAET